jgi:hypothetical protein
MNNKQTLVAGAGHACPQNPSLIATRKYYLIEKVSHLWVSHSGRGEPPKSVKHFSRAKKD